jgi:hypothetical protein
MVAEKMKIFNDCSQTARWATKVKTPKNIHTVII